MDRISSQVHGVEGFRFADPMIRCLHSLQMTWSCWPHYLSTVHDLQLLLDQYAAECELAGIRVGALKSKDMVHCGKDRAEPKGEAFDLLIKLCYYLHLCHG